MKTSILSLIALLILITCGNTQTVKTLGYNTTNGQIVYSGSNSLTFTNNVTFSNFTVNGALAVNTLSSDQTTSSGPTSYALALPTNTNVLRITGIPYYIERVTGGRLGAFYYLINETGSDLEIRRGSGISVHGGQNLVLGPNEAATLIATGTDTASIASRGGLGATWLTNTNAATFRSDIGLGDNQRSAIFPSETSVKKVRYFNNQLVNSAPVNTALKTNVVTILPFYLPKRTTNLSAVSVPRLVGTASPVYCAIYSAFDGYRNATLVETQTATNSRTSFPADNVYVNFTNTFEPGWYILSGRVDVTTLTNIGNYTLVSANDPGATMGIEPVSYGGVKGTYNSGHVVVTGTNFPTTFTNLSQDIATSALLYWFPYY